MPIRACIFDLFGTLVPIVRREEYYAGLLSLAKRMGVSEAAFLAECISGTARTTPGNSWSIRTQPT